MQAVVQQYARALQESLGRQGRAPFVLAGVALFDDLQALQDSLARCLALYEEPHLRHWHTVLARLLPQYAPAFASVRQGQAWVSHLRTILDNAPMPTVDAPLPNGADAVARDFAHALGMLADQILADAWLTEFRAHIFKVSDSYWSGLFHCYGLAGMPRTNNALESLFGTAKHRLRRQTGLRDQRRAWLRYGIWLLYHSEDATGTALLQRLQRVSLATYRAERQRFEDRQAYFRRRWCWRHQRTAVLQQLENHWAAQNTL